MKHYTLITTLPPKILEVNGKESHFVKRDKLLDLFGDIQKAKGIRFKNIVPVVKKYPECFERISEKLKIEKL